MLRKKPKTHFFAGDLTEKGGAIDILLRQRRYLGHLHQYSKMCSRFLKQLQDDRLSRHN